KGDAMINLKIQSKRRGQALVEFALFATLLFFMLAAAVDVGLMFFSYQAMASAAQEGANFGSMWPMISGTTSVNDAAIRLRVRGEPGPNNGSVAAHRISIVDLQDL